MSSIISASLLGCDLARLGEEAERARLAGVDWLHYDVMDGNFVDNISFGLPVLYSLNKATDMPIDVHLMINSPEKYVERFVSLGADRVCFHLEASNDPVGTLDLIRSCNAGAGIAIRPHTPAEAVFPYLEHADMILVMTVEPGFGGQEFIPETVGKISEIREELERRSLSAHIQVDGGINPQTAEIVKNAGADVLVAGTYLFGSEDMKAAVSRLR